MDQDEQSPLDLTEVGQKLVGHSKSAEFTATRGLVIELFPFIFEASDRMSARAIGRFLEQEQKIKLSQVTITRALNDPKKSGCRILTTSNRRPLPLQNGSGRPRSNSFILARVTLTPG